MKAAKITFTFIVLIIMLACNEKSPIQPHDDIQETFNKSKKVQKVRVMTRNVYVGTDVDRILQEQDPTQIPIRVAEAFQMLINTNFPERAQGLANEVYETQPDLIGLQEVSLIRIQSPGDAIAGGSSPAEEVVFDYLDILIQSLNGMGLEYDVVAKTENLDVEMPMIVNPDPLEFDDVRLTDYDVILAKKGVKVNKVVTKNYETNVIVPDLGLELLCGYVAVTAKVNGIKVRFVNTHLQDADLGGDLLLVQMAQAQELVKSLQNEKIPIILVGDFNSAALIEPTYEMITKTYGYSDSWLLNSIYDNIDGFTYGHDLDLLNDEQNFWKRIDYIFVKNEKGKSKYFKLKNVSAIVTGDEEKDKTPSGLWPSDHGGVFAELDFIKHKRNKCKRIK